MKIELTSSLTLYLAFRSYCRKKLQKVKGFQYIRHGKRIYSVSDLSLQTNNEYIRLKRTDQKYQQVLFILD